MFVSFENHPEIKNVYVIRRECEKAVSIISKTLLFEDEVLDQYAEQFGFERDKLTMSFEGKSLEFISQI